MLPNNGNRLEMKVPVATERKLLQT